VLQPAMLANITATTIRLANLCISITSRGDVPCVSAKRFWVKQIYPAGDEVQTRPMIFDYIARQRVTNNT
jgi:hypothetical protein